MKKILIILCLVVGSVHLTSGQIDDNYKSTLADMFKLSGSEEAYKAAIKQMVNIFRDSYSSVSSDIWDELEKEFLNTSLKELVDMLAPVYYKYLTLEDLKGIITFYKTDLGQKFAAKTPLIMQESMQVGQQWGAQIGQKMQQRLKEKGY